MRKSLLWLGVSNSLRALPAYRAALGSAGGRCPHTSATTTSWRCNCLPGEPARKNSSETPVPVGKGAVPGTDVYLPAETGSLGSRSCTSLHAQVHRVASLLELAGSSLSTIRSVLRTVCQVSDTTLQLGSRWSGIDTTQQGRESPLNAQLAFGNVLNVCLVRESVLQPLQQQQGFVISRYTALSVLEHLIECS